MNDKTTGQTLMLALGAVVLLAGLVGVVTGFAGFASSDPAADDNTPMFLFAGGALAAVVGFGIIAFTRASILTRNGGYARITVEQGVRPSGSAGDRFCSGCGTPVGPSARFCESCGAAVA